MKSEFFAVGDCVKLINRIDANGKHIHTYAGDGEADFIVVAIAPNGDLTLERPSKLTGHLHNINPAVLDLCDKRGNILWENPYARV